MRERLNVFDRKRLVIGPVNFMNAKLLGSYATWPQALSNLKGSLYLQLPSTTAHETHYETPAHTRVDTSHRINGSSTSSSRLSMKLRQCSRYRTINNFRPTTQCKDPLGAVLPQRTGNPFEEVWQ